MLRPVPVNPPAAWASVQACDAEAFGRFMSQGPRAPPYEWDVGASACVRFDRVMWHLAMSGAARSADDFAGAAAHGRDALREMHAWSSQGVETARVVSEPRVYAAYCSDRARAAMSALDADREGCTDDHIAYASYAALCAGTARVLLPDAVPSSLVHGALGRCLEMCARRQPADAVGRALGAWRAAHRNYALADRACDAAVAQKHVRGLEKRNLVLMQDEEPPDRAALLRPRCIGGGR